MGFKKGNLNPNWKHGKTLIQFEHYEVMSKREINSIIKKFGKKPMIDSFYEDKVRIIYDETAKKDKPERCSIPYGFYQIAIYSNWLIVKEQHKHISKTNKQDLMEFKKEVSNLLGFNNEETYMVSDKRFRRMNLSPKHFKIFKRKEHNLLHRIVSTLQKKHYAGKPYSKQLWAETAISHIINLSIL